MSAAGFTIAFVAALATMFVVQSWLGARQVANVRRHRDRVPDAFASRIPLAAHQKAADYTVARQRFARVDRAVDLVVTVGWTLLGGIALAGAATSALPAPWDDVALTGIVVAVSGIIGLPLSWWRTFVLEARFGFNRTTLGLWITDMIKGVVVGVALGLPLLVAVLWLVRHGGDNWWLWVWALWIGFQVLILVLYPTVIAPLFNKFSPLPAGDARARIEALLARCGFAARGLFVMDGSKRSSHGNAYFVGFGRARRIVFFDTLLTTLAPPEVESVLAHELGHYALKHIVKMLLWSAIASLLMLALLAWLSRQPWFYAGLGVGDPTQMARPGVMLNLFFLALPPFVFLLSPLTAMYSRRHEFEADAFAARNASADALASALVKMYEDNASTLTPDPLHSAFYDSHPPAAIRIGRLASLANTQRPAYP
ncbi:MAG: M48 family metallopeptidase [Betaproteobacteria bacterium]